MTLLTIQGVSKRYGPTQALDSIDLAIEQGEYVVLLGPSGSGKTTLLSILGGFVIPDTGKILLAGRDITRQAPATRPTTTVFQDYALFPHMNIARNVGFGLAMRNVAAAARRAKIAAMLELVGLAGMEQRKVHELSGGQRQRVALARALVVEPKLLLLDEPLGALDLKLRQQMQEELRRIQRDTATTFIHVTHDQDEAMHLADRIVVLNHGRIEDQGPPQRLYLCPASRFSATFMGESNLLPGSITQSGDGAVNVATTLGTFTMPGTAAAGTAVELAIRPEQLLIDATVTHDVSMLGKALITERVFSGSHQRCRVRIGDYQWSIHLPQHSTLRPGTAVTLAVSRHDIVLLL